MNDNALTTCLWFDTQAEEAANYYSGIFEDFKLGQIARHTEASPGTPGTVLTVEFEINGQKFLGLNGGPQYQFTEAVSFMIPCRNQDEVDYYWDRLSAGGQEIACGWLKDRFGLCWQIVPTVLPEMLTDPDREKANRAMAAMMQMTKFDIAALRRAFEGESAGAVQ
jgi:predicted 3-demethylubiquinone-9 3-methyltransferase (glyoxalase superfamily)